MPQSSVLIPRKQFTLLKNNFTLRCSLYSNSIKFLVEEDKDNIKDIHSAIFYTTTLPSEIAQYFDTVDDLFDYINDNPHDAINMRDLNHTHCIYIRANYQNKIIELKMELQVQKLSPQHLIKRENIRLKATLAKVQQQMNNAFKLINELKVNESFNNQDYQKLRIQNKKLLTENRKLHSEKNALIDENIEFKNKLEKINMEIRDNISQFQAISHHHNQETRSIRSHSINTSLTANNNGQLIEKAKKNLVNKTLNPQQKKAQIGVVDLESQEESHTDNSIKKSQFLSQIQQSASLPVSHLTQNNSLSQDHLSVLSKPHSIQSSSFALHLQKLSALSQIPSSTVSYSKKQQKQYKKSIKMIKQFTYFEDNISHICQTKQQNGILFNFFIRKIKQLKLLYRASQNNFEITKFHRSCDKIKHTILLVETQYGKKIGAYTPIQYVGLKKPLFYEDINCQTFLFSVTNKQKYKLINTKKALFNFNIFGPSFGRLNLHIQEHGNLKAQNKSIYPFDFQNPWQSSTEASNHFIGSNCQKFKILQWEVYAIEFCQ